MPFWFKVFYLPKFGGQSYDQLNDNIWNSVCIFLSVKSWLQNGRNLSDAKMFSGITGKFMVQKQVEHCIYHKAILRSSSMILQVTQKEECS